MTSQPVIEAFVIQEERHYRLTEITLETGLDVQSFLELVDSEVISVIRHEGDRFLITERTLRQTKRAARIARDFELAPQGLALAVTLLERIEELEARLARKPG
jgi:chaperone modulatory protein CbpM